MPQILTFTTDFGADSHYVAQMKAAILRRDRQLTAVDITHSIAPQNIRQGAALLRDSCFQFPSGSAHVAVVDPGVGSERGIAAC